MTNSSAKTDTSTTANTLPSGQFVGDLLVRFKTSESPLRSRAGLRPWVTIHSTSDWTVDVQANSVAWLGYPCHWTERNGRLVVILGELYGELDTTAVMADIFANSRSPTTLNGHYLILDADRQTRRLHVWTNRFGTLHAYHCAGNQHAALGTFSPAVSDIASRRELDTLGLFGFLSYGFFPQNRTYFRDVRILEPATHYEFDQLGRLAESERYWNWNHNVKPDVSYEDSLCEFAVTFTEVMDDILTNETIALPISGGLDSRTTVSMISNGTHPNIWAYSYGYGNNSVETRIARQVAQSRSLELSDFSVPRYLFRNLSAVMDCVEGFQDVTQSRQASIGEQLAAHAKYVVAAHWGDVWLDDAGVIESPTTRPIDQLASSTDAKLRKRGSDWLVKNVRLPHSSSVQEELSASLRERLLHYRQLIEDDDFVVKAFKTDSWSFRWTTASLRMYQQAALPRLPFYDTRLADLFCSLPTEHVRGRRLQIDYLKRYARDLANIRWEAHDANLFRYNRHRLWRFAKRATKKAGRIAARRRPFVRNWEVQFLNPEGRAGLERWLTTPGLRLHDLYEVSSIQTLLSDLDADSTDAGRGYTLSMLLTLSAWLETFG